MKSSYLGYEVGCSFCMFLWLLSCQIFDEFWLTDWKWLNYISKSQYVMKAVSSSTSFNWLIWLMEQFDTGLQTRAASIISFAVRCNCRKSHCEEIERLRAEQAKRQAIQQKLQQISPCPAGFNWQLGLKRWRNQCRTLSGMLLLDATCARHMWEFWAQFLATLSSILRCQES